MKVNKKIIGRILAVVLAYALITFLIKGGVLNRQYTSLIVPIGVNIMLAVSLNPVSYTHLQLSQWIKGREPQQSTRGA